MGSGSRVREIISAILVVSQVFAPVAYAQDADRPIIGLRTQSEWAPQGQGIEFTAEIVQPGDEVKVLREVLPKTTSVPLQVVHDGPTDSIHQAIAQVPG